MGYKMGIDSSFPHALYVDMSSNLLCTAFDTPERLVMYLKLCNEEETCVLSAISAWGRTYTFSLFSFLTFCSVVQSAKAIFEGHIARCFTLRSSLLKKDHLERSG